MSTVGQLSYQEQRLISGFRKLPDDAKMGLEKFVVELTEGCGFLHPGYLEDRQTEQRDSAGE